MRGAGLGLLATAVGLLLFSAPEYLQQWLNVALPVAPATIVRAAAASCILGCSVGFGVGKKGYKNPKRPYENQKNA